MNHQRTMIPSKADDAFNDGMRDSGADNNNTTATEKTRSIIRLNNLGVSYLSIGNIPRALSFFRKSLEKSKWLILSKRETAVNPTTTRRNNHRGNNNRRRDASKNRRKRQRREYEDNGSTSSASTSSNNSTTSGVSGGVTTKREDDATSERNEEPEEEEEGEEQLEDEISNLRISTPSSSSLSFDVDSLLLQAPFDINYNNNIHNSDNSSRDREEEDDGGRDENENNNNKFIIYDSPIRIDESHASNTALQQSETVMPSIIIFNLALTHQLWAAASTAASPWEEKEAHRATATMQIPSSQQLKKAADLYKLTLTLQRRDHNANARTSSSSELLFVSSLNNLTGVYHSLGDKARLDESKRTNQQLATILVYLTHNDERKRRKKRQRRRSQQTTTIFVAGRKNGTGTPPNQRIVERDEYYYYESFLRNVFNIELSASAAGAA